MSSRVGAGAKGTNKQNNIAPSAQDAASCACFHGRYATPNRQNEVRVVIIC